MVDRQYIYNIKNKGSMNFFSHPDNVCLSYVEHFKFSMYLSIEFAKASPLNKVLIAAICAANFKSNCNFNPFKLPIY